MSMSVQCIDGCVGIGVCKLQRRRFLNGNYWSPAPSIQSIWCCRGLRRIFWHLETASFLVDLDRSGLPQALQWFLLNGHLNKRGMEAEVCDLDVYGKPFDLCKVYIRRLRGSEGCSCRYVDFIYRFFPYSLRRRQCASAASLRWMFGEFSNRRNDSSSACIAYAAYFCEWTVSLIMSEHCVALKYMPLIIS